MAGYSSRSLAAKLGIADGVRVAVVAAPGNWVTTVLAPPRDAVVGDLRMGRSDVIVLFAPDRRRLRSKLDLVMRHLEADGALWVAWPKRASGVATDLTEDVVRAELLPLGVVDVKVAAFDETWSGLRFVVRTSRRPRWGT